MHEPDKRGRHILDAVVAVVADGGLEAVSIRSVASAAGVSLAQVQYYFRSKDELLAAAFQHVSEDVEARAGEVDTTGPFPAVLSRLLCVWLPLDEARARHARVWVAFAAAAVTSPTLGLINAEVTRELRTSFAGFLRRAQEAGELDAGLDAETEASLLLAMVDGLVIQSLATSTGVADTALVTAGVDAYLSRLFTEENAE